MAVIKHVRQAKPASGSITPESLKLLTLAATALPGLLVSAVAVAEDEDGSFNYLSLIHI